MNRGALDRQVERQRYDSKAEAWLDGSVPAGPRGLMSMRPALRAPYLAYENALRRSFGLGMIVLELGAGTGMHTGALLATGARVVASDISEPSLQLLSKLIQPPLDMLSASVADMERLPFGSAEFDGVASAGSLSYGDPDRVRSEILRVLRPGGRFICVDSLNENPVYRLNRWIHYRRGERSLSTLRRMPGMRTLTAYRNSFASVSVAYFGALTFLVPLMAPVLGEQGAARVVDAVDRSLRAKRSAFKFVMVATKGQQ